MEHLVPSSIQHNMHTDIETLITKLLNLLNNSHLNPHLEAYIANTCILLQQACFDPRLPATLQLHLQRLFESIPKSQLEPQLGAILEELLNYAIDAQARDQARDQDMDVTLYLSNLSITK